MRKCPEHGAPLVGIPCEHCIEALREASDDERDAAEQRTRDVVQTGELAPDEDGKSRRLVLCQKCRKLVRTRRRPGEDFGCPACKKRFPLRAEDILEETPTPESKGDAKGGDAKHAASSRVIRDTAHDGDALRPSFTMTGKHMDKLRRIMRAHGHADLSQTVRWLIDQARDPGGGS